jgi:predicted phage terminase large subunit-like protein
MFYEGIVAKKCYEKMKMEARITHSWDTAIKAGSGHDASVCAVFEQRGMQHRLLDVWSGRVEYPELKRKTLELAERDHPHAILIEDKASGQSLIQDLRRSTMLPVIAVMPKGDKLSRFAQVTPLIEAGRLALPREAPWLAEFEREVLEFPGGRHDDCVDALSQYLNHIRDQEGRNASLRRI